MSDEIDKLLDRIKRDGIKFIRFEAPSIMGQAIGMLVPARNCEHFLRKGFPYATVALMQTINTGLEIDSVAKSGFRNVPHTVDVDSYKVIPWKELVPTASLMVSQPPKYNHIYAADSRSLCSKQLSKLNNMFDLDLLSSIEHEFTLQDSNGKPISGPGCYHLKRISKYSDFFSKIDDNLHKMGIECDRLHSEGASGQYEITALPAFNIDGADNAYWIRNGVQEMAEQYKQWNATFMTHLFGDDYSVIEDDSGAHCNISLHKRGGVGTSDNDNDKNIGWDKDKNDISDVALYFLGGILEHIRALAAFCCPTTVCYKTRLNSPWVSAEGNWGKYNRTALIRAKPSEKNTHFEFRLPSSLANPYLVLAAIVCAGCDGLKNKILPPKETPIELLDEKERAKRYKHKVPRTLEEALDALQEDKIFCHEFDPFFCKEYILLKKMEIEEMKDCEKKGIKPLCYSLL